MVVQYIQSFDDIFQKERNLHAVWVGCNTVFICIFLVFCFEEPLLLLVYRCKRKFSFVDYSFPIGLLDELTSLTLSLNVLQALNSMSSNNQNASSQQLLPSVRDSLASPQILK